MEGCQGYDGSRLLEIFDVLLLTDGAHIIRDQDHLGDADWSK